VLLATGGCGKVYLYTTNPDIATGDGVAMAYRAGVPVANMEFIQFHPTCLFHPKAKSFLISEAVRGEGGILRNDLAGKAVHGRRASAQIAGAARHRGAGHRREIKKSGAECVFARHHAPSREFLRERFPAIYAKCLEFGIDMAVEPIPVVPGGALPMRRRGDHAVEGRRNAGALGGGRSRLHGPCTARTGWPAIRCWRRWSCAHRAPDACAGKCRSAARRTSRRGKRVPRTTRRTGGDLPQLGEIRRVMWDYVGIVRTNKRLQRARARIANLQEEIQEYYWDFIVTSDLLELRNIATVAELIIASALQRPESRGLHYNLDYPKADPAWAQRA
jgi:L-aspartate oxidase